MGEATASRWCRHGKDRVYVTAADGTKLGYLDLQTGHVQQAPVERAAEFQEAIIHWRLQRSSGGSSPPPDAVS